MRDMRDMRQRYCPNGSNGNNANNIFDANNKIIAVDFDGTIVRNHYPFIENPNNALIEFIKANRRRYIWILWTCRHGEQLRYAVEWLKSEYGLEFDFVNENVPWKIEQYGDTRKIYADYYIDDKNCRIEEGKLIYG